MALEPPSAVELTVHALPSPGQVPVDARTRRGRLLMLLVLAVCAAPVVVSYVMYFIVRPEARTNYSELVRPRDIPADLPLHDLSGAPVRAATLKDQWLLVVVASGACPALCERELLLQRQLREALGRDRDRVDKVWLVLDDTPVRPELVTALSQHGAETTVLRVPRAALAAWLAPAPGHALEDHIYIVDPLGSWMMRAPPEPEPAKLKRDVEKLLRASAGWDQEGRPAR